MTKDDLVSKDTALKMAIEALETCETYNAYEQSFEIILVEKALNACKEALEQPEPRLFLDLSNSNGNHPVEQPAQEHKIGCVQHDCDKCQKGWQGLTDDEVHDMAINTNTIREFYKAIEQALKEKNTS
jgi:hypothetical protein